MGGASKREGVGVYAEVGGAEGGERGGAQERGRAATPAVGRREEREGAPAGAAAGADVPGRTRQDAEESEGGLMVGGVEV